MVSLCPVSTSTQMPPYVVTHHSTAQHNYCVLTIPTQLSEPTANTLAFSITVCLADSRDAADGANISLMVEYAFGSYQSSVKTDMKLAVDNSTHVELGYTFYSDILEFFPGDKIKFSLMDYPASSGIVECTSTEVLFYIPEWLRSLQFTLPGDGFYGTTFNLIANTTTSVHYSAGTFYFGQPFKIKFSGQVASTVNLPYQSLLLNVQIGMEIRCKHYVHSTSIPPGTTEIDRIIKFQTGVIHSKLGQYSVLGLGDPAQIRDCQITASMVSYPQYGPLNIRFQNGTGWLSGFRTSGLQHHNYLTIVLGQLTTLYSVRITSTVIINHRFLDLYASLDGITFEYIKQVIVIAGKRFNGSTAIRNPVEARAFRFVDRTFQYADTLTPITMELVGKVTANDSHAFGKFVKIDGTAGVPLQKSTLLFLRLFAWPASNQSTKEVLFDDRRRVGDDLVRPEQTAVVLTRDYGQHWVSTNADGYDYLVRKARVSVNATAVPWNTIPNQFDAATKGVKCTAYNAGPFNGASFYQVPEVKCFYEVK
ncbi:hypothetical protein P879_00871 [Paragonimus westermani]|uniref:F5/8 type C domain-containing protein n=1 Tax=Paragonimus westermani TaxID=34504 RepID=A0A8T0DRD7_9TREM|nr:hypothetical protein P879_00871 [Paragonimus westermani]